MSQKELGEFIDMLLTEKSFDPEDIFKNEYKDNEDLMCSFFTFLVSKCIIRYAPKMDRSGVYTFSKPGRVIIENDKKRTKFIKEFIKFYG